MKNICLELVPIKSSSCRSFVFDSSVNCTPTSLCKNRSFKYGRKLFNSISVYIHHFYRIATCFSSRFSGSFNKSIILIIVCVCTPFNIRFAFVNSTILVYIHKAISFIFIFMINARKFLRIWEKNFSHKAMNMIVSVYRVFCKRNPTISVSANSSFKDTSVKIPFKSLFPTNCLTFGNVWKPSNSPKIAYLIRTFVPFDVFPYLFHNNKKCSKCSEDGTSIVLLTRSNKSSNIGISYIPVVYVCKDNIKILYSPTK